MVLKKKKNHKLSSETTLKHNGIEAGYQKWRCAGNHSQQELVGTWLLKELILRQVGFSTEATAAQETLPPTALKLLRTVLGLL